MDRVTRALSSPFVGSREVSTEPSPSHAVGSTDQSQTENPWEATTDRAVSNRRVTKIVDDKEDVPSHSKIFISHKWGSKPSVRESDKRTRTKRDLNNVSSLGNVYNLTQAVDDSDHEESPNTYQEAVQSEEWKKSMRAEVKALVNRGCWRVVPTPHQVEICV